MTDLLLPEKYINGINAVRAALSAQKRSFSEVRLFGSCAKGTYSASSDLDILILSETITFSHEQRALFCEIIEDALWKYKLHSDVVFYTQSDYKNDTSLFTKNLHTSILILKGDEQ